MGTLSCHKCKHSRMKTGFFFFFFFFKQIKKKQFFNILFIFGALHFCSFFLFVYTCAKQRLHAPHIKKKFFLSFIEMQLIYYAVIISSLQHSVLFSTAFNIYSLSNSFPTQIITFIGQSSLCQTAGPRWPIPHTFLQSSLCSYCFAEQL